jgi:hypothetical protein
VTTGGQWHSTRGSDGTRQAVAQGIRVPVVGLEMGQSGRLQWASCLEKKRKGNKKENARAGFGPGEI